MCVIVQNGYPCRFVMFDIMSHALRATYSRSNLPSMVICDVRHWQAPAPTQSKEAV